MSGVGLVGLAAEGNENVFLNDNEATLFRLRHSDTTIEHFAKYPSTREAAGPSTVATDTKTEFVVPLPMEDDGIGSAFIELQLPEIRSTKQEGIAWNRSLVSAMIDTIQIKSNKNVVKERTGTQLLLESRTQLNTTRAALFHRLTGMTKQNYSPSYPTYTDRQMSHSYPALNHQLIRTHSPFGHMVERPVDISAGTVSDPTIRPDLWLQHIKQTKPESYFTELGVTRSNLTLTDLQEAGLRDVATEQPEPVLQSYLSLLDDTIQVVNTTSNVLVSMANQIHSNDVWYSLHQQDMDAWLRIWQEVETDWCKETFVTNKESTVSFVSTLTDIETMSGNLSVRLSIQKDLDQTLVEDSYELFEIQRGFDRYGFPNQTQWFVGRLTNVSSSTVSVQVEPEWSDAIIDPDDLQTKVIHRRATYNGCVNAITQIVGALDTDVAYYSIQVRDSNASVFTNQDHRQCIIGNVTADFYLVNATTGNITIPKSDITDPTILIDRAVMLRNPAEDSIRVTHDSGSKETYEILRDAFPTSWDTNAKPYVEYRDILDNTTVQLAIPELAHPTSNATLNYIVQKGMVNATIGEISKLETVLNGVNATPYTIELSNCLSVFAGLQEDFKADRYGGWYPNYRLVQNYLHGMNHLLLRLRQIPEIVENTTTNTIVTQLFPAFVQQFGDMSYHYHRDILKEYTETVYDMMQNVSIQMLGYFPGTLDEVNVTIATLPSQFPNATYMPSSLFEIESQRTTLMEAIDYVNGTVAFVTDLETGAAYDSIYFSLADLPVAPSGAVEIREDRNLRFIFWWRVFHFIDKCRLIREVWLAHLYDSNISYFENLIELRDTYSLECLAFCIQFYDCFQRLYPVIYDEMRLRAPVITQQNLPFSRAVRFHPEEQASANITHLATTYDIGGTLVPTSSTQPFSYVYEQYRFPQETPTAFSHLYGSNRNPSEFALCLLEGLRSTNIYTMMYSHTPDSSLSSRTLWDTLVIVSKRLWDAPRTIESYTEALYESYLPTMWQHPNYTEYCPDVSNLSVFPTKQEAGFFQSVRGSSMGFIVAKEWTTGIPYEGFQTETKDWSNVMQYENRVANLVSSLTPYETYSLSSSDVVSIAFNSTGINLSTFFSIPVANVSPQVFGFRVNLDGNPLPVSYEPITYRSYSYRIPKYIPQSLWEGCEQSLVSMLSNPMIEYFEYLRINLIHPDDVPAALVVTNYGEVLSQQDDPWYMSHSDSSLKQIDTIIHRTGNREATDQEENNVLQEVGFRKEVAARVIDPVTQENVVAFQFPTLTSPTNASRNPYRNEQVFDTNLRLLYRTYIATQNQLDAINAIESPNYIPRHLQDIVNRIVIRCLQEWLATYLIETTPTSRDISLDASTLYMEEYMVSEIRTVLTEFLRIVSKSNIPIENHRSVKVAFMNVWNRWINMMRRMIQLGVIQDLLDLIVASVYSVYTQRMVPRLDLYQYSLERRQKVWLEIIYAIFTLENALNIEIDPTKGDNDWIELVYSRLTEETRNAIGSNPFEIIRTDLISIKDICLNILVEM